MKLALCAIPLSLAAVVCSAQQPGVPALKRNYVISEAKTISVQELQQRNQSKARGVFSDAKMASRRGDHARAIKLFEKVLRVDPLFSDARNDLAVELIICGQADRAIDQLRQLIERDPRFVIGYTNLAVVLCNQKSYSETESVVRRALAVDPNSAKASLLLAVSLYGQGKQGAETRNALETAAKSSPLATKLLKEWFGNSEIAEASLPD